MKIPGKTNYRSLHLLNITQFLGALNDNIFKLLIAYLLINVKGEQQASSILAIAGMVFVVPFLLFSNAAGVLADKISKRNITVGTKIAEVVIMALGVVSIYSQWEFGSYFLLFLMATQSAVFGPSKFGIIPELVSEKYVSKANGLLASFTYLAIILGSFLAPFITDITNKKFTLVALFCLVISFLGLFTSLGISKIAAKKSKKKINPLFLYEIYQTLRSASHKRHLFSSILGSAFFLFLGGFIQMNIIPFAMQSLELSPTRGGYLFLMTAVGIALGAILAGKLSKDKIEPGLSCIAGYCLAICLLLLFIFAQMLYVVIGLLVLLGIFGGLMLIPLDSFIQVASPDKQRGQVIAASNFLSFVGVLLAAFTLYFFGEKLQLKAATSFAVMSLATFIFITFLTGKLSSLFFPYLVNKIYSKIQSIHIKSSAPKDNCVLVVPDNRWKTVFILFSIFSKMKVLVPGKKFSKFPYLNGLVSSFIMVNDQLGAEKTIINLLQKAKKYQDKGYVICLLLDSSYPLDRLSLEYKKVLKHFRSSLFIVHTTKEEIQVSPLQKLFYRKQIDISFQKRH